MAFGCETSDVTTMLHFTVQVHKNNLQKMRSLMATINKHKMKHVGSIETLSWSFMTCSGYLSPCCEMQLVDCTLLRRIFLGTKPPRRRATSNLHECTLNKPNSIKQHNNVKEANQKDPANLSITALKLGTIDARHVNMSRPTGEVYETPTLRLQIPLSLSLFSGCLGSNFPTRSTPTVFYISQSIILAFCQLVGVLILSDYQYLPNI